MSSNTGYRALDDSFHNLENSIEEHTESIRLKNGPFSKQAAAAQAIPQNLQVFNSSRQTRKLFLSQSIRWIGTLIFVALMLATLKVYHDKDNFSHDQKYAFNTIVTALSLGLGLNFFVGQHLASWRRFSVHLPICFRAGSVQRYSQGFTMENSSRQKTQRSRDRPNHKYREPD